jgi:ADP-ribosylglycohydrolase
MATKKSKKTTKPVIKDLKTSKRQVSAEEADATRGGALLTIPTRVMATKPKPQEPSKTIVSTDITHTSDGDVDVKTD